MGQKSLPISKNYKFPQEFLIKSITEKNQDNQHKLLLQGKHQNPISSKYRCTTYNFHNNTQTKAQSYCKPISLKIVTYNVWFQQHNAENRFPNMLKLLLDSNADFICLQQVTSHFLNKLRETGMFKNYYIGKYTMHWYDTIILSKYKCVNYKIPFQISMMERSLILSQYLVGDQSIVIGNVHLESLDNAKIRISQLKQAFSNMNWASLVILVGDYNFSDDSQQDKSIHKDFKDLWKQKNKNQKGYTMLKTPKYNPWRPDHILMKGFYIQKSKISIIGDFSIKPFQNQQIMKVQTDGIIRTPSDHLGLVAQLLLK